jgi:hypothetical protein
VCRRRCFCCYRSVGLHVGFIFPERFLSEAERRKAIEYRKQYRSWRLKANRGSHGEFSKVLPALSFCMRLRRVALFRAPYLAHASVGRLLS